MKLYNVTRWLKLPVTVMCEGDAELEHVRKLTPAQYTDYWYNQTDDDEKREMLCEVDLEQIGEQETEPLGEDNV